jgi:hypothetical protein
MGNALKNHGIAGLANFPPGSTMDCIVDVEVVTQPRGDR